MKNTARVYAGMAMAAVKGITNILKHPAESLGVEGKNAFFSSSNKSKKQDQTNTSDTHETPVTKQAEHTEQDDQGKHRDEIKKNEPQVTNDEESESTQEPSKPRF